jgi:hypothetical protein
MDPDRSLRRAGPVDVGPSHRGRHPLAAVLMVLPLMLATSCSTLGPDTAAADDVAVEFHRSILDGDGTAACALLAPATLEEVESTAGTSCPDAILDQDVPDADQVQESQAFGRGAQVVLNGDVLFLSIFGDHWLITAAGCTSRGERPYDCTVKGE